MNYVNSSYDIVAICNYATLGEGGNMLHTVAYLKTRAITTPNELQNAQIVFQKKFSSITYFPVVEILPKNLFRKELQKRQCLFKDSFP